MLRFAAARNYCCVAVNCTHPLDVVALVLALLATARHSNYRCF